MSFNKHNNQTNQPTRSYFIIVIILSKYKNCEKNV